MTMQCSTVTDITNLDTGLSSLEFSGAILSKFHNCPMLHFHIFKRSQQLFHSTEAVWGKVRERL